MLCAYPKCNIAARRKFCSDRCKEKYHVFLYRKRTKKRAVEYLGGSCTKCGYKAFLEVLAFHHKDPTKKDFSIGSSGKGWGTIQGELDKCVLLCSNCHIETHVIEREARQGRVEVTAPRTKDPPNKCPCGRQIGRKASSCVSCGHVSREKIKWPAKEELTALVWAGSMRAAGKALGVTDSSVRKRCHKQGIYIPNKAERLAQSRRPTAP